MDIWDWLSGVLKSFGVLLGIGVLLIGLAAAWIDVWFVRRIVFQWRKSARTQHDWPRTDAKIDRFHEGAGEFAIRMAYYTFVINGVGYSGSDEASVMKGKGIGSLVQVAYDPADPRDNAFAAKIAWRRWMWLILSILIAAVLAWCAYALITMGITEILR